MKQDINKEDLQNQEKHTFIFIRHGQTTHNILAQQAYKKYKQKYHESQQYKQLKYNPSLIDGNITQKGKQQAILAKQFIKDKQIDLVLVSPLRRALVTCDIIFGDRGDLRICVEPLMCQYMSSAVDIGSQIQQSYHRYSQKFNFHKIKPQQITQQNWYINLIKNQKTKQLIQQKKTQQNLPYHLATLQILKQTLLQTFKQMRQRVQKLKRILLEYKKQYKNICLVGHGVLFHILTTTEFSEDHRALNGRYFENCVPEDVEIIFGNFVE